MMMLDATLGLLLAFAPFYALSVLVRELARQPRITRWCRLAAEAQESPRIAEASLVDARRLSDPRAG
ncbi:MAG: hypothetical protein ACOYOB_18820 [Myxococcota bacterium]